MSVPFISAPHGAHESPAVLDSYPAERRASWVTHKEITEAVENEMRAMEHADLKKLRLYKVALAILTLIGLAILFIIPVSMLFGVSLWIPVVITLGLSLLCAVSSQKLRARYEEIRLKYRALQVYHRQLVSCHMDLHGSTLSKYSFRIPKRNARSDLLAKLRPDQHTPPYDGGVSLDRSLNLSGEINTRYQCDALLGIGSREEEWRRIFSDVVKAKSALFSEAPAHNTLKGIAQASLQVDGSSYHLPVEGVKSFAESLMRICSYVRKVGVDVCQVIRRYEQAYHHSRTLLSWVAHFSPVAQTYLSKSQSVVDSSLGMLDKLQTCLQRVDRASWLVLFATWQRSVYAYLENPTSDSFQKSESLAHQLSTHDGVQKEDHAFIRDLSQACCALRDHPGDDEYRSRQQGLITSSLQEKYQEVCVSLGGEEGSSPEALEQASQQDLAQILVEIGDIQAWFDKMHVCIQLGNVTKRDIEQAMHKHPDRQRVSLLSSIDQAFRLVNKKDWGATSDKPIEEILAEKEEIIRSLESIQRQVDEWSLLYETFKSQKLSRILMKDFSDSHGQIQERILKLRNAHIESHQLDAFITQSVRDLEGAFEKIGGESSLPKEEEIAEWAKEYQHLVTLLEEMHASCQAVITRVNQQGMTSGRVLLQSLKNTEGGLKKKIAAKAEELALALSAREPAHTGIASVFTQSIAQMEEIIQGMQDFEGATSKNEDMVVEEILHSAHHLFSSLHTSRTHLDDLSTVLASRSLPTSFSETAISSPSAHSVDMIRMSQGGHKDFWQTRNRDLNRLLESVKKSVSKWNLGRTALSCVFGMILLAVSLLLLSSQIVWLPIGISAIALLLQVIPLGFDHILEKKMSEVHIASLAKNLLPSTKILASEFNNAHLDRLASLQDVLQLEGYEQSWAREVIQDLEGSPARKHRGFKETVKQLKKDAEHLNSRMERRFGHDRTRGSESPPSLRMPSPQDPSEGLSSEVAQIEAREDHIHDLRMRYNLELTRHKQNQLYCQRLQKRVEKEQGEMPALQEEMRIANKVVATATMLLSSEETPEYDSEELASQAEELITASARIYDQTLPDQERMEAVRKFDEILERAASHRHLMLLRDIVDLSSCVGKSKVQAEKSSYMRMEKIREWRSIQADIEDQNHRLNQLGLSYLSPFIEFSTSSLFGKGRALLENALHDIRLLKIQMDAGDEISPEHYGKVKRALDLYLAEYGRVAPLAYGEVLGDAQYQQSQRMLREEQALHDILDLNTLIGHHDVCQLTLKRIEDWIDKQVQRPEYQTAIQSLVQEIQNTKEEQEITGNAIQPLPEYVLRTFVKRYHAIACLLADRLQEMQNTSTRLHSLFAFVHDQERVFKETAAECQRSLAEQQEELKALGERKQELLQKLRKDL